MRDRLSRRIALAAAACLAAGWALAGPAMGEPAKPRRIVSMNQCTDQLLLLLVEPERIASVSFVTHQPQWTPPEMAGAVAGLGSNHALAEEVLTLKPDLVLTGVYTGRSATALLRKLGYTVVTFEPESTFDQIRGNIRKMGEAVGETQRAEDLIAAFDARLASIRAKAGAPRGILADVGVNGWMAGNDTLLAAAANAAGYRTLGQTLGYSGFRYVSLEQIIASAPDAVAPSNAWTHPPSLATNALRHPALKRLMETSANVTIPERLLVCGSPYVLDAAELLVEARRPGAR
jgi:iron complex transport system substrate-binding protein